MCKNEQNCWGKIERMIAKPLRIVTKHPLSKLQKKKSPLSFNWCLGSSQGSKSPKGMHYGSHDYQKYIYVKTEKVLKLNC